MLKKNCPKYRKKDIKLNGKNSQGKQKFRIKFIKICKNVEKYIIERSLKKYNFRKGS